MIISHYAETRTTHAAVATGSGRFFVSRAEKNVQSAQELALP
jgi:hypothetical protein